MKRILSILIVILLVATLVVVLCSCNAVDMNGANKAPSTDRFVVIEKSDYGFNDFWLVLCDKETRVMYLFVKDGYGGGLTVILDEDGKPVLYGGKL